MTIDIRARSNIYGVTFPHSMIHNRMRMRGIDLGCASYPGTFPGGVAYPLVKYVNTSGDIAMPVIQTSIQTLIPQQLGLRTSRPVKPQAERFFAKDQQIEIERQLSSNRLYSRSLSIILYKEAEMGNSCECVSRQTDDAEDALLSPDFDGEQPRGPPPPYQVSLQSEQCRDMQILKPAPGNCYPP